jgi:hypothetical protein
MRIRQLLGSATIIAALLSAPAAHAADLTGVWFGKQECDRFDGHKFHTPFRDDVVLITQIGDQINMVALFSEGVFHLAFQGTVINDDKKPGREAQAGFTACETSPGSPYQETGRATKAEVKKNGHGEFEATSIFLQLATDESPTDTGTCTWHYKRVDSEDPGVPDCATILSQNASTLSTAPGNTFSTQRRRP